MLNEGLLQLHANGVAILLCVMDEQSIGSFYTKAEHNYMSSSRHLDDVIRNCTKLDK